MRGIASLLRSVGLACVAVPGLMAGVAQGRVVEVAIDTWQPLAQDAVVVEGSTGVGVAVEQLDELLAPIALYPDALLAQVLSAATYPLEVVQAARWVRGHADLEGVDEQAWDPSVSAVAHYPTVLKQMDDDLDWTVRLGQAFLDQPKDVMDTVQRLRARARVAGSLVDSPQQIVMVDQDVIRIVPAEPEYIYVPVYNPSVVYVNTWPSYVTTSYASSCVSFGVGFRLGWWLDLDCDWRSRTINYCHDRPYHVVYGPRWHGQRHDSWRDQDCDNDSWRGRDGGEWKHDSRHGGSSRLSPTYGRGADGRDGGNGGRTRSGGWDGTRTGGADGRGDRDRADGRDGKDMKGGKDGGRVEFNGGQRQWSADRKPNPPRGDRSKDDVKVADNLTPQTTQRDGKNWSPKTEVMPSQRSKLLPGRQGSGGSKMVQPKVEVQPEPVKGDAPRAVQPGSKMQMNTQRQKIERVVEQGRARAQQQVQQQAPAAQPKVQVAQPEPVRTESPRAVQPGSKMQVNTQRQAVERAAPRQVRSEPQVRSQPQAPKVESAPQVRAQPQAPRRESEKQSAPSRRDAVNHNQRATNGGKGRNK